MTDKFEGCVVREMRRLDELMKNLHLAAKVRTFFLCCRATFQHMSSLHA